MVAIKTGRWFIRKACFILYVIILELVGLGCLTLAILAFTDVRLAKLRIWERFDYAFPNIVPFMAVLAAAITILVPIAAIVGIVKRSQIIIMIFCGLIVVAAFAWFGIGAWCVTMQQLIINDIPVIFKRLKDDGAALESDALQFLKDLREYMPLINNRLDFQCCQSTADNVLTICALDCGERYQDFFQTLIFPSLYAVFFGAGTICLGSLACACLLSCHLDDVNPAL